MANGSNGVGNFNGVVDILLAGAGTTSSQKGLMNIFSSQITTAASTNQWQDFQTGTAAEDSTGALTFAVTFDWTSTNGTATMEMATVELLK